jgi:hypothetical protein
MHIHGYEDEMSKKQLHIMDEERRMRFRMQSLMYASLVTSKFHYTVPSSTGKGHRTPFTRSDRLTSP